MQGPVKRHHIDARTEQVTAALERIAKNDDTLFSTKELAALFGVTVTWCKIRRMRGEGPVKKSPAKTVHPLSQA